ncbi:hypothetical protein K488DRAFT_55528 [Vararia minispora EC-137]|uniref:Uncharacterized protein n=1 Tax=Vararia minispora EC-137 TaxID=1314806 RepID=A0ACB8QDE4_9AGAM|nr:hypothetical protein K488DRAFT_55528 [Vararia minispora EC-137]
MHIKKLKVRARRRSLEQPCAIQLASMLGCWAATSDVMSTGPCAGSAEALFNCMRTLPPQHRQHAPAINFHLARLNKNFK